MDGKERKGVAVQVGPNAWMVRFPGGRAYFVTVNGDDMTITTATSRDPVPPNVAAHYLPAIRAAIAAATGN